RTFSVADAAVRAATDAATLARTVRCGTVAAPRIAEPREIQVRELHAGRANQSRLDHQHGLHLWRPGGWRRELPRRKFGEPAATGRQQVLLTASAATAV